MKGIQIFKNENFGEVRVAEQNGKPMFWANDVAKALGYVQPAKAIIDHCKGVSILETPIENQHGTVVMQKVKFITESDVYRLVMRSKLPQAESFQDWVVEEVLPAIRQTGGYIPSVAGESEADIMARALLIAQRKIEATQTRLDYETARAEALKNQTVKMQGQIDAISKSRKKLLPAATFAHAVETSGKSVLIGELAKILKQNGIDIGQNRLFAWMRENGYLCQRGEFYNLPTQKAMDLGLLEVKKTSIVKPDGTTIVTTTPKITGKGQIYFTNKFLTKNV